MTRINKNGWLFALFLVPLLAAQMMYKFSFWSLLMHLLLSLSLVTLLNTAQQQTGWLRRGLKLLLFSFYFAFVFMLLFEVILYDFTGKGFTNEVYFHFEVESLRIGFNEYPVPLLAFAFLILLYVFLINKLLRISAKQSTPILSVIAVLVLIAVTTNSSMVRFVKGLAHYHWQESIEINQDIINQYIDLGVMHNGVITAKNKLQAEAKKDPKNLILIYLESFNRGLLDLKDYPQLTPQLNQLSQKYQNLNHISSSYVTIEGIISSQCGTMLPMTAGNNTFLSDGQLLSNMPCLGDVLKAAGYSQYYLGGAQMEFAGKGLFLETHGYDHIWGLEHWKANGLRETLGIWGLSDSQLFTNAINTIKTAAKNPPYHLSLLTLGTHLPGYVYSECQPYSNSDEAFINAIHCTDQLVGQFVNELEQAQLLENTVLMIVADHGIFPSVKMKELFGEEVDDRRLIGITNYPNPPDAQFSSYDLAPTLLDMLKIKHNAAFLFGQSLFEKPKHQQKYVTRYADWQGDNMVLNPEGGCIENQALNWPLNKCEKQTLLNMTSKLLEHYSIKDTPEPLSCDLDVKFIYDKNKHDKWQWFLWLNDEDHFGHFYHKGYLLKTLNYRAGHFVFMLNDDLAIAKHVFIEHDESTEANLNKLIQASDKPLLIIQSTIETSTTAENGEKMALQIDFFQNNKKLWSEKPTKDIINGVNLCR